ncbi:cyclic nucleotide-binding domain-containing protein [Anaerolineales bacterium HSG6]|nr:cyclic nucleotide-binding domain-containing protein [Anaerolineales bacterium HSG6]MDM8530855.1 cyclic nucleotide-binding domain-containing protein [Anaerolineales bacterium HSG25]
MDFDVVEYLRQLPLFKKASTEALNILAENITLKTLAKDEVLIRKGDPSASLFIIQKGWVKIVAEGAGGKEIMLNQLGPGQIIGETAMLERERRSTTVIAIRPVQALEIQYDDFLAGINQNADLAMGLVSIAFDRLTFANLYIEKATEWSQYIAEGNYDAVQKQLQTSQNTVVDMNQAREVRIGALLSAFFKMVDGVKKREENLKEQIVKFKIQIDDGKKDKEVDSFMKQSMFFRAREAAAEVRRKRKKRRTDRENDDSETKEPAND